jgi:hypothetical protein
MLSIFCRSCRKIWNQNRSKTYFFRAKGVVAYSSASITHLSFWGILNTHNYWPIFTLPTEVPCRKRAVLNRPKPARPTHQRAASPLTEPFFIFRGQDRLPWCLNSWNWAGSDKKDREKRKVKPPHHPGAWRLREGFFKRWRRRYEAACRMPLPATICSHRGPALWP